LEALN